MSPFSLVAIAVIIGGFAATAIRKLPFSLVVAVVIGVVFALEALESPYVISDMVLDLALQPEDVLMPGRLYTLFTSMFLHASFFHLIFNIIALILIGPLLEERIGPLRFAVIYVVTGMIGGLAFALIHLNESAIVLGASGAISGILGAFASLYPREKIAMLYMFIPLPPMRVPILVAIIILIETLFALVPGSFVAHEAHLMGLASGILLGPLVMSVSPPERVSPTAGLEELAIDDELKRMLEKIESETEREVKEAWVDEFIGKARCPKCGGPVLRKRRKLYSDCGWSLTMGRK